MYLLTTFRPCVQPVLFSIFIEFLIFYYKYGTIQHAKNTIHNHNYIHKHMHIHIHIHIHMHILLFFEDSSGEGLCDQQLEKGLRSMLEKSGSVQCVFTHLTIHIPCCLHLLSRWSQNNTSAGTCDFSTKTKTAAFLSVSSGFHSTAQYSTLHSTHTQHSTHTPHPHTHTCTPATDRDLESALSKSHTRKNPRNMPEKGKVRGISGEGSCRKWRKTNRTIW